MYERDPITEEEVPCRCGEPSCPRCNPVGIVRLSASPRTRNRFLFGIVIGAAVNLLIPFLIPVTAALSFLAVLSFRIRSAPRMLAGLLALVFFWVGILPSVEGDPSSGQVLLLAVFLAVIYIFFSRPGRQAAGELLFRGRGLAAGLIMSSTLAALLLSVAALLFFFMN